MRRAQSRLEQQRTEAEASRRQILRALVYAQCGTWSERRKARKALRQMVKEARARDAAARADAEQSSGHEEG